MSENERSSSLLKETHARTATPQRLRRAPRGGPVDVGEESIDAGCYERFRFIGEGREEFFEGHVLDTI